MPTSSWREQFLDEQDTSNNGRKDESRKNKTEVFCSEGFLEFHLDQYHNKDTSTMQMRDTEL